LSLHFVQAIWKFPFGYFLYSGIFHPERFIQAIGILVNGRPSPSTGDVPYY